MVRSRALIEFLIGHKRAVLHRFDYVPKWTPPKSPARHRLEQMQNYISQHLVHMLEEPTAPSGYNLDFVDDLFVIINQFVVALRAAGLDGDAAAFEAQLRHAKMVRGLPLIVSLGEIPRRLDREKVQADWERARGDPSWQ